MLLLGIASQAFAEQQKNNPYPISGYWLFGRADTNLWPHALSAIRNLGADTVVQFGVRLKRASQEDIRAHPLFSKCQAADIATPAPPRNIYTFETQESFGPALLADLPRDRLFDFGDKKVWLLNIPTGDCAQPGASDPHACDLIYVSGRPSDSVNALLHAASDIGAHVYVGLPCAPADPRHPWDPDLSALPALQELTRRILADYAEHYRSLPSLAGVYQSQETPVSEHCLPSVLTVYRSQHALVRSILPGKSILISPYWDARKRNRNGTDSASVHAGMRLLARQNVDIIAPQDSRGTGKVGLFWPDQSGVPTDVRLAPAVGCTSYGEAYAATTTDFYRTARAALDEANLQEGLNVALWANLEAFEPGSGRGIQRTTYERLDQAIMFAGIYPSKLICFMWDNYFTARAQQPLPLGEELASCDHRPIVVQVESVKNGEAEGLLLRGYGLDAAVAELTFTDPSGVMRTVSHHLVTPPPKSGETVTHPLPARLQTYWVPFDTTRISENAWAELTVRRDKLRSFHPYRFTRELQSNSSALP